MNSSFLQHVAKHIKNTFGTDLSQVAVVFPNKRASIFLNQALVSASDRPIWSPAYTTISDLFRNQTSLQVADPIKLICDLYKVYIRITQSNESFDHFYGWGQILLSDFDDIDKHMVDARQVFRNVEGLHEYDDISYLTPSQQELIKRFFSNFSDRQNDKIKERFLHFWTHLYDIYTEYRNLLAEQGLAYEGQLYRTVAEQDSLHLPYRHYLFVGFNLMHPVELKLVQNIRQEYNALFYWDYDRYYTGTLPLSGIEAEAGYHVNRLRNLFPNALDETDADIFDNLNALDNITYATAATDDEQARYVATWLTEHRRHAAGTRTAVVLADEQLLPAVVYSIPKEVEAVNITTGYPLALSPLSTLIQQLALLQVSPRFRNSFSRANFVNRLKKHPYISFFDAELLEENKTEKSLQELDLLQVTDFLLEIVRQMGIYTRTCEAQLSAMAEIMDDPFFQEALFRFYTLLQRIHGLIESGELPLVGGESFLSLLRQLISQDNIPFHGEPAQGIQVMGVLETRNLDFDHVLVLSCNDGNLPRGGDDSSFIPYAIRKAFGLTTIDKKVSIYAYYFYSMIQRAKDVTLLYNNSTTDGKQGEMSRFMLQMLVRKPTDIKRIQLYFPIYTHARLPMPIEKNEQVMRALESITRLAPTAINSYLRCPLRFYYRYCLHVDQPDTEGDDAITAIEFGLIFHRAAELLYTPFLSAGGMVTAADIDRILKDPSLLERYAEQAFEEEYFEKRHQRAHYNGIRSINKTVIITYLKRLLAVDKATAPFRILGLEKRVEQTFGDSPIQIGGIIDRLDCVASTPGGALDRVRVVDYKTSRAHNTSMPDVESLFSSKNVTQNHTDYFVQTILYALMVAKDTELNAGQLPVSPALFYLQNANAEQYHPILQLNKEDIVVDRHFPIDFASRLSEVIGEIFDPNMPFRPTDYPEACNTCPFHALCY